MADRTGQQLGNFRVIRPIGRGGFAEVYLGELVPAAGSDLFNVMILVFNYFLSAGSVVGAEDIINAMELRCFGIGKRSWLIELNPRPMDRLFITLCIVGFFATTLLNILGNFYTTGFLHVLHIQGIPQLLFP